jgi:hypothetical protein
MKKEATKAELRAWMDRWKLVNDYEREELRSTPVDVKFRQLATLMHSAHALGWKTSTQAEIDMVRDRWIRLKRGFRDAR